LTIYYIYGIDVTVEAVLAKGNFDQMKTEVENLSTMSHVYISTNDSKSYSCLFNDEVKHLPSKLLPLANNTLSRLLESFSFFAVGFLSISRKSKEVEVIVSQGTTAFQGALANLLFRKKHVLFLHYFAYNEQLLLKRSLLAALFRIVESFSIKHSNIVVAPNEKLKTEAFSHGAKRVQIIPNFVEITKIDSIGTKNTFRKKYGFGNDHKVILFVGRLHKVKNIDFLLKSFAQLNESTKCILLIVGDGPEKQHLIELATNLNILDKVRFEGFKPKETVLELMKASDILVLPSIVEGQPRVVLEAWVCGLPVIASRNPGLSNLIDDKINGLLFDLGSEEKLVNAINLALDSKLAKKLIFNGRTKVKQYDVDTVLLDQRNLVSSFVKSNASIVSSNNLLTIAKKTSA
jgi:glycosyltransferase involved in cell wall biosynthesis